MGRNIDVDYPVLERTITHDGKDYTVVSDKIGHWRLTQHYRGEQVVNYRTVGGVLNRMATLDAETKAAEERKKALAAANREPIPAWLQWEYSEPKRIGVRGIDQRSGYLLITNANGSKESEAPSRVLRDLTDAELADYRAALRRYWAANDACDAIDRLRGSDVDYLVPEGADATIPARYDAERDGWVVEFDGEEVFSQDNVRHAFTRWLGDRTARAQYRYGVSRSDVVVPVPEIPFGALGSYSLFKTAEDANRYVAAEAERAATRSVLDQLRKEFAFDVTVFAEAKA